MIKKLTEKIKELLKDKKTQKEKRIEKLEETLKELYDRYEHFESLGDKDSLKKCKVINKLIIKVQTRIKDIKEFS